MFLETAEYFWRFFIFLFFNFVFYKNIFFFRNLQKYTPAAPLPGGRGFFAKSFAENLRPGPWRTGRPRNLQKYTTAAPLPGGRGFSTKSFAENLRPGPWRTCRSVAGRPDAPRPPGCGATASPPLYKGLAATPPLICLTKNPEKKKKREEGGRGGVRERGEAAKPCRIFKPATAGN